MTPLGRRLAALIRAQGPIPVGLYMSECLADPEHGYYMRRDPLGADGDFTTAPEISQMFGELIGLWCADVWQRMGAPDPVVLLELGPGRGTLMADVVRAAGAVPAFRAALDVHLVEISPALRARQEQVLAAVGATWHDRLEEVPDGPTLVVANEFFDALPVRQFVRTGRGWRERLVDVDPAAGDDRLCFALAPEPAPEAVFGDREPGGDEGAVIELRPAGEALAGELARRLAGHGGAALIIDYGPAESGVGDSLQAVRGHAFHPVLDDPGECDLTAHVDFAALARAARRAGAAVHGPVTQGAFLARLGIATRAAMLAAGNAARRREVEAAVRRLTAPDAMGELFKVMALADPALPAPAGFEAHP